MKQRLLFVFFCSVVYTLNAQGEIYKRVDEDGHVTYSSTPIKGAQKLHLEPLPTMAPQSKARGSGDKTSDFRVDSKIQTQRDDTRRKILEDELATEQKALEQAQLKLREGQDSPEVYKNASGQTFRNVAKYEEKVAALQDDVNMHEKNIQALKTELSHLNN